MQNSLKPVSAGNIPDEVNVIIEIPAHSSPVKYEIDKATGAIFVDRFISTYLIGAFIIPYFF
jgi:inorganic pyrophosphatase